MPDPRSDDDLVRAINAGPPAAEPAFASLYLRHRDWALRVAARLTRTHADAADITQEAFITLLRQFPGFRLRGKVTTFLYPVLRNRALALSRRRRVLSLDGASRRDADPPSPPIELPEDLAPLRQAVDALPEPQREVLLMRLVDGMDVAEVAAALSIPPGTVKSRLHAAVAALRSDPRAARWAGRPGTESAESRPPP